MLLCNLLHDESISCKLGLDTGRRRLSVRLPVGRQPEVGIGMSMRDVPESVLVGLEEAVIDKAHRRTAHRFQVVEH